MKILITAIAILLFARAFSQEKNPSGAFGRIQDKELRIVGDTARLKSAVLGLMSGSIDKATALTVEIRKGQTFGEAVEDYYCVLLHNNRDNITIAKWLEKVEDDLFLVNEFTGDNYWQVLTTACIGKDDCTPQVAIIDSKKRWGCGTKLVCSSDDNCTAIKAIETQ